MKIVLAPNSFRDALAAPAVARAMAVGVERAEPAAEVVQLPLADGGDGTLEVLAELLSATLHTVTVTDSLGRPVEARLALADGGRTAILEMAEANGLRRLTPAERDPLRSHTGGTGEMIRAALDLGARQILLGAGGSATIDGGTGALAALGAVRLHQPDLHRLRPDEVVAQQVAVVLAQHGTGAVEFDKQSEHPAGRKLFRELLQRGERRARGQLLASPGNTDEMESARERGGPTGLRRVGAQKAHAVLVGACRLPRPLLARFVGGEHDEPGLWQRIEHRKQCQRLAKAQLQQRGRIVLRKGIQRMELIEPQIRGRGFVAHGVVSL